MGQVNWFDRKFESASRQNILPSVIERLDGTPLRLENKLSKIDPAVYTHKPDGNWSILEHVGHLSDLEPLWQGRLEDILNGAPELRPTDLANTKTTEANHNAKTVSQLLEMFYALRMATLTKLFALKEEDIFRFANHPRLKTPMHVIDLFTFVAEHDDHHLAKISAIAGLSFGLS